MFGNEITNVITINSDESRVREILSKIKDDKIGIGSIDFNKIIPMPNNLIISGNAPAQKALAYYKACMQQCAELLMAGQSPTFVEAEIKNYRLNKPEQWNLGKECCDNIQKYGAFKNEREFQYKFWESDNSCGYAKLPKYEDGSDTIRFLTAWKGVPKIMMKLSDMFPDVDFKYRWADEDIGRNVGEALYKIKLQERVISMSIGNKNYKEVAD